MNRPMPAPRHIQEMVLCLLLDEAPHELRGRTYVQKLIFLFQQEAAEDWFVFEANDYGPFSKELYAVLDYCIDYDYVSERTVEDENGLVQYRYEAGPAVGDVFGVNGHHDLREAARSIFDEYPTDDLTALIEAVYTG